MTSQPAGSESKPPEPPTSCSPSNSASTSVVAGTRPSFANGGVLLRVGNGANAATNQTPSPLWFFVRFGRPAPPACLVEQGAPNAWAGRYNDAVRERNELLTAARAVLDNDFDSDSESLTGLLALVAKIDNREDKH